MRGDHRIDLELRRQAERDRKREKLMKLAGGRHRRVKFLAGSAAIRIRNRWFPLENKFE